MSNLSGAPAPRIYYDDLDAARGILMALGVVLHMANLYAPSSVAGFVGETRHGFYDWLVAAVHLFRMPAFFLVSGFFCMMSLERYRPGKFLNLRAQRILIPLVVTALTFNVLEILLRSNPPFGAQTLSDIIGLGNGLGLVTHSNWLLHLWFLVVIFIYFIAATCVFILLKQAAPVRVFLRNFVSLLARAPLLLLSPVLAATAFLPHVVGKILPDLVFSPFLGGLTLFTVLEYAPYFTIGAALFYFPEIFKKLRAFQMGKLALFVVTFIAAPIILLGNVIALSENGAVYVNALASWVLTLSLFGIFSECVTRFKLNAKAIAGAALTVYLVHHFLVSFYGAAASAVALPAIVEFLFGVTLIGAISFATHFYLVQRAPILTFLFNGKRR